MTVRLILVALLGMSSLQRSVGLSELTDQDIMRRGGSDHQCEAWLAEAERPFFRDIGTAAFLRLGGVVISFASHYRSPTLPYVSLGGQRRVKVVMVPVSTAEEGEDGETVRQVDITIRTVSETDTIRNVKLICQ